MEEYVEDELADGEDDKKRIQRAEFRAGKKRKSTKGAKNKKGPTSQSKRAQNVGVQAGRVSSANGTMSSLIATLLRTTEKMPGSSSGIQAGRSLQQLGPCFLCARPGDFRKSCPLLLGTANK